MRLSFAAVVIFFAGCQSNLLRIHTNQQATTLDDLFYQQILDNFALLYDQPAALPYFALPIYGSVQVQRALQVQPQIAADLITSGMGRFFGRYLLDKQQYQLQGTFTEFGQWQIQPDHDPDRVFLMRCAYRRTLGAQTAEDESLLKRYYDEHPASRPYSLAIHPGWLVVGKKADTPRHACYIGRHCDTFVWVPEANMEELSRFTLAIMDFDTVDTVWTGAETGPTQRRERQRPQYPQSAVAQ